ncbi:MAG: hypothetical protein ACREM1_23525 [Longimicrobiales bacterium]
MKVRNHVVLLAAITMIATSCVPAVYGGGHGRRGRSDDVVVVDRRGGPRVVRVPRGHYPPPGHCRVWIPGRPPGHQPPPRRCGSLVRRVPHGAFVLYNAKAWDRDYDWRRYERRYPGSVPTLILNIFYGGD